MNPEQLDRIIAVAERFAAVMEKRLELEYPKPEESVDAVFVKVGQGNADQPESKAEYEEFPEDEPSSFEALFQKLNQG